MLISSAQLEVVDWSRVPPELHAGETGAATWRTHHLGDVRIRMVEYSAGYRADHWCRKGHVVFCIAGSLDIELESGERLTMKAGESYQAGDGEPGHRSSTAAGARLFIVD